ncbi:MAG: sensor histidine kinase [Oscillospiraceae bacterium]
MSEFFSLTSNLRGSLKTSEYPLDNTRYVMSRILSYNINKICHVVEKVQFGDLDARFSSKRNDEIYALGENVNQMLLRIHNLIKEKYVIELKAKEFELNLLQSQINPHFLCNTLRTIEYMASVSDPRTVNTIKKLIYIFRRCLDVKNNLISLEEELKYVKNYTEIQQIRFGDKFCVEVDMPKELEEIRILQFTIQPLVENAIYHGVELLEANGKILILVEKDNTHIVVRVTDNGPGMNAEKLQEVRDRLAGKIPSESVGLINVNDRLKLQYGNSCGIIIESTVGIGTSVTLIMNEE